MANSVNTTWIVSCVIWKKPKCGLPDIGHCDSRSYRKEGYARERFDAIVDSLKYDGFAIADLDVPYGESYEGIRASKKSDVYAVVYIDKNPVWRP